MKCVCLQPFCFTHFSIELMVLHVYPGCDPTCAFTGNDKQKLIKVLQKMSAFEDVLGKIEDSWEVSNGTLGRLEDFTHVACMASLISDSPCLHLLKTV